MNRSPLWLLLAIAVGLIVVTGILTGQPAGGPVRAGGALVSNRFMIGQGGVNVATSPYVSWSDPFGFGDGLTVGGSEFSFAPVVDPTTKYNYAEMDFGLLNPSAPGGGSNLFAFGAEGTLANNGDLTGDFYIQNNPLSKLLLRASAADNSWRVGGDGSAANTSDITGDGSGHVTIRVGATITGLAAPSGQTCTLTINDAGLISKTGCS